VAGAVFSGFAMVLTLMIPARRYMGLKHVITARHLEAMAKVMLCTGLIVTYGYLMEHFAAWYSGNPYEQYVFFVTRPRGPYAWAYFHPDVLQRGRPQMFWFRWARRNVWTLWVGAVLVNVGMWFRALQHHRHLAAPDFIPSNWAMYYPTLGDPLAALRDHLLLRHLFLLFLKFLPAVAVSEVKELNHELHGTAGIPAWRERTMKRFVLGEFEEPYACVDAVRRLRRERRGGLDA